MVLTDAAHMPQTTLRNAVAYEDWIGEADGDFAWATFDENTAAGMCYTSGTTGNPKGVRLFAPLERAALPMTALRPDCFGLSCERRRSCRSCRCSTPMAGRSRFSAPMAGAKLVMPGQKLDGASIYELLEASKVTMTAAVPTVWLMLLQHLEDDRRQAASTSSASCIGGSACPRAMIEKFEENYGVEVAHAWGMTEMSPIGSICAHQAGLCRARRRGARSTSR